MQHLASSMGGLAGYLLLLLSSTRQPSIMSHLALAPPGRPFKIGLQLLLLFLDSCHMARIKDCVACAPSVAQPGFWYCCRLITVSA